MHHAIENALRLGFNTVQVFVKNQRQWRANPLRQDDLDRWFELRQAPGFCPPVAHATYLINLASANPALWEQSRAAYLEELQRCHVLDIPGLVVHPGSAAGGSPEEAIQRVAAALNRIFDEWPQLKPLVLLETTAGQGASLGRSFEELAEIIGRVQEPQRIGVCVDTCHVFAAGYDIRDPVRYGEMVTLAERLLGRGRIRCWHFNDSKGDCGSRLDRHEHIGQGRIGLAGFANVLADERFRGVPMILETPKERDKLGGEWDAANLAVLRKLAADVAAP